MKKYFGVLICSFLSLYFAQVQAQNDRLEKLAKETEAYYEGFRKNIGENEFSYHSIRADVNKSMITRATDGKMLIEWETETVAPDHKGKAGFLWIASMDRSEKELDFRLSVNGSYLFTIHSSLKTDWLIQKDGVELEFVCVETDMHEDAHGYMRLLLPEEYLEPGQAVRISLLGENADDNTWIIIYQSEDTLEFLRNSLIYNVNSRFEISPGSDQFVGEIELPKKYIGKKLTYIFGENQAEIEAYETSEGAGVQLFLEKGDLSKSFSLSDDLGVLMDVPNIQEPGSYSKLLSKSLVNTELVAEEHKWIILGKRVYKPKTVQQIRTLAESKLAQGKIYLMNSSHQDIAWMDTPEKCVLERDTMLIMPLVENALIDPNYKFDVEHALILQEFLHRHPERKEDIQLLLDQGKISCGASYNQPYEEMYSGESLVRQFYLGSRWLKKEFNYDPNIYWNEDVPGRSPQMPQIASKAGVDYLMISRHERGFYRWFSPDASSVIAFTPGHYAYAYTALQKEFYDAALFVADDALKYENYFQDNSETPVVPLLSDWDMSPAKDYGNLIKKWSNIKSLKSQNGENVSVQLPEIEVVTAPKFFDDFLKTKPQIPEITGERPNLWVYIHGAGHQKALKASRKADILLPMAEKWAGVEAFIENDFSKYPAKRMEEAWKAKIYPDHGWGGKGGDITDALFKEKYEFALSEASSIVNEKIRSIASHVKTKSRKGKPLLVFNSLSWKRCDPVQFALNMPIPENMQLVIKDSDGQTVDYQLSNMVFNDTGEMTSCQLTFIAEDIPALGYKSYYLSIEDAESIDPDFSIYESEYYTIELGDAGIKSIYDKEFGLELLSTNFFEAGEVFTLRSVGNGAGEFASVQQADMKDFDKTGNHAGEWELIENGPVYSKFKIRKKIKHAIVEEYITLYKWIKKIDFDISLLNWEGVLYREYRLAMPLKMKNADIAYEVPFGMVEVGKGEISGDAGERYKTPAAEIHPRGIENWISAKNDKHLVCLSSSVVTADYEDITGKSGADVFLQPILMASRKSCHWEGNEYLQTGDHHFHFSLTSSQPNWESSFTFGRQANEEALIVFNPNAYKKASLPESYSFLSSAESGFMVSAFKKAEDANAFIIRLFDYSGKNREITLDLARKIASASKTNIIEEGKQPVDFKENRMSDKLGKYAIETFKVQFEN